MKQQQVQVGDERAAGLIKEQKNGMSSHSVGISGYFTRKICSFIYLFYFFVVVVEKLKKQ